MAKSGKKKQQDKSSDKSDNIERVVSDNRRARHDYDILVSLECGIVLRGSEVKSLRNGSVSLAEAYCKIRDGEVWLVNCDIPEYFEATYLNHKPKRDRKLLLHRHEIYRFSKKVQEKGITLVPLKLYFSQGKAKLLIGLCKGRREYDKRQVKKDRDAARGLRLATMKRQG